MTERNIHLVGTVPAPSTDDVFNLVSTSIAPFMTRIPDGETGVRNYWISSQARVLHEHPQFEPDGHDWMPGQDVPETGAPKYRLRKGVAAEKLDIPTFGYGAFAQQSYELFRQRKQAGEFHGEARFQVGLPTPMAFCTGIISAQNQAAVAPAFNARMARELSDVLACVPHDELAIQWDTCIEIFVWEGAIDTFLPDPRQDVLDALTRLGDLVPEPVQLGYHLCYGDFRHKHGMEPKDMATMVMIANGLTDNLRRPMDWIHMPVPRDRDDDAYFAPLAEMKLQPETELFLGLVHYTDGEEGTRRRMATANRHVRDYGIATECGLGRRDPDTIPDLLAIHARCATA